MILLLFTFIFLACSSSVVFSPTGVMWERYNGDEKSIKQYLDNNKDKLDPIEGIYTVSSKNNLTTELIRSLNNDLQLAQDKIEQTKKFQLLRTPEEREQQLRDATAHKLQIENSIGEAYKKMKSDDFARVAIIRENKSLMREFISIVITAEDYPKYAINADFTRVQNDKLYLSKQFSPDGKFINYAFSFDQAGILSGSMKEAGGTFEISYAKLYPVN